MEIRDFIDILTVDDFKELKRQAIESRPPYNCSEVVSEAGGEYECGNCTESITYLFNYCPFCGVEFIDKNN